jgi:small subunit ribosomal protein S6
MRRYESVVILDSELADDDIQNFTDRYGAVIKDGGGEVIKIEDWGVKKFAYLVKKKEKGRYILLDYVGVPALVQELERQFRISEDVMKFLSVKLDDHVDLEAFKAQVEEEKANKAAAAEAVPEPATDSETETPVEDALPATGESTAEEAPPAEKTAIASEPVPEPEQDSIAPQEEKKEGEE